MIIEQLKRGIKIVCVKKDLSIEQAAALAGMSPSTVYRWMQGVSDIKLITLCRFFEKGLKVSFEYVLKTGKEK